VVDLLREGEDRTATGGYGQLDWWRSSDQAGEAEVRDQARRMELRGSAADERATRAAYLDLLAPAPGERVLEVGSGSGVVLREIARRVAPGGLAVGLDYSPHFLTVARELAEAEGLGELVNFRLGDARALPLEADSFDACLAATSLAHIPDGERAIPELVRVTRPGGRVGVFDRDVDASVIAHPDRELTRRIIHAATDHATVDGWLARKLPRLLRQAGLVEIQLRGFVTLERERESYYGQLCYRRAQTAEQCGAVSAEEARRWIEGIEALFEQGDFVGGMVQMFVWGRKPSA
jgi:ubiquinone/menaquinone biosynthesis C-methylase UbiE